MEKHTTLKQLALEFSMDRKQIRRYVIEKGFTPVKIRDYDNNLVLALSNEEAEELSQMFLENAPARENKERERNGFFLCRSGASAP